jgi:NAD(P)-dependent dehydrogenase (short-subunit alcohol dehydrogenase family)
LTSAFNEAHPDITVNWVTLEENILRERVTTDIATGGGQYDILTNGNYEVPIWGKQGWLVPLEFEAAYEVDDMLPAIRGGLTVDGKLYAAPFRRGESLVAVYYATKAAVISLTQSAGLNLIQHGINVNAIAPGVVDGEHWEHVDAMFAKLEGKKPGQKKAEVAAGVPAGRFATPEDLTGMAMFLASKEADYILAQTYNVDGGQWMS